MSFIEIIFLLGTGLYLILDFLGDRVGEIAYYGKLNTKLKESSNWKLPKTRFKDMYLVGLLFVILVYYQMIKCYFFGDPVPNWLMKTFLNLFGGPQRQISREK